MKYFFTISILLFLSSKVFSQSDYLTLKGIATDTNDVNMGGVGVQLFQDGKLIKSHGALMSTSFEFDSLELEHVYQVHFSKKGYSYKIAEINMKSLPGEKLSGNFPMQLNSTLFPVTKRQAKKLKFMKTEPVAKASYSAQEGNMVWDMEYIEAMKKKIAAALK